MKAMKVSIMLYRLRFGGAERVMLTLARAFIEMGIEVEMTAFEAKGEFVDLVPHGATLTDLGALGTFAGARSFARYLERSRPDVVIANGDRCTAAAYLARRRVAGPRPRVISVVHNDLVGALALTDLRGRLAAALKRLPMTYIYPRIDRVIAVSGGVADSVAKFARYPRERISVIYNPVDVDELRATAGEPCGHEWFDALGDGARPQMIVAVGRLTEAKDFATLLRAFAIVRDRNARVRLAIIGEGAERSRLESIIDELGLGDSAALLGFRDAPHRFVSRAELLVVSSLYEGLSMVLLEASAVGTPCVSTDCPSGPSEILPRDRLVPIGDAPALAEAICRSLARGRVADFNAAAINTPMRAAAMYKEAF